MTGISEETKQFIEDHILDDVKILALKGAAYKDIDMTTALTQIEGRQRMRAKVPSLAGNSGILFPQHLPLEQCSSEATARYKRTVMEETGTGESFTDLTGGFGIDCLFMSAGLRKVTYVERQESLAEIAKHNFKALKRDIDVVNTDCTDYLRGMQPVDWIFIDPARRDSKGRKTVAVSDCEPDISAIDTLLCEKGKHVMVKLSPMLDIHQACGCVRGIESIHVVAVDNECKELLFILSKEHQESNSPKITCVNLQKNAKQVMTFTTEEETGRKAELSPTPLNYLYEPNVAILKGGGFNSVATRYGVMKLHPNSHLYTSEHFIEDFPGRRFTVCGYSSFNKKEMRTLLRGITKANVAIRNFPGDVASLRQRLKIGDGGEDFIFATTTADNSKILIHCR